MTVGKLRLWRRSFCLKYGSVLLMDFNKHIFVVDINLYAETMCVAYLKFETEHPAIGLLNMI